MSFLELAKSRRSIRKYKEEKIKHEELELCVEAARYAPSACNSQSWKFIIIDDPTVKDNVAKNTFSGLYSMNTFAQEADAFIVVVSEPLKFPAWLGGKLKKTDFRQIDIGIAVSHIVLQAQELKMGTCILGWFNKRKLKKILSVPLSKKIELVIALGYSAQKKLPERRLKDKKEVISLNRY